MNHPPNASWDQKLAAALVRRLLRRDLRKAFHQVCWAGPFPELPSDLPVVVYANHHNFYDGHLLWLMLSEVLDRPGTIWMRQWKRFPFFAALGAQPFPRDAPRKRMVTIRRTQRLLQSHPDMVLVYFPEGGLRSPDQGLGPYPEDVFARLDRLLPDKLWWPVGIRAQWRGEARPTALLAGGTPHSKSHGREREQLRGLMEGLTEGAFSPELVLLQGAPSSAERWNFSLLASLCRRYL